MYICICKAITDGKIRAAVADGACTLRDLSRGMGLGTCCGKCVPVARELIGECRPEVPAALVHGAGLQRSA